MQAHRAPGTLCHETVRRESLMTLSHVVRAAAVSIMVLFLTAPPSSAQSSKPVPAATARDITSKAHRLVLQVNTNEPAAMNLALNNATNVEQHYKSLGEKIQIEVVTFGPGLHMLRDDTSPVKDRIKAIAEKTPSITFKACGNTQENMGKAESKTIPLLAQATLVKSGVVRVMELQEQGWTYVRP
jgi:intracellular sulfur oxidation DsrE/DsrF family protein